MKVPSMKMTKKRSEERKRLKDGKAKAKQETVEKQVKIFMICFTF